MQTDPENIARIAAGLSKAQREAIAHPSLGPFATFIYSLTSAGTRCALQRKGIVVDVMYATALTPLGLAVRDYLKGQTDAQ